MPELLLETPGIMFFQVVIVMLCVLMAMIIDLGFSRQTERDPEEIPEALG